MKNTSLTPEQALIAAYSVLILGVPVQDVAVILNVNMGRVSEACSLVKTLFGFPEKKIATEPPRD